MFILILIYTLKSQKECLSLKETINLLKHDLDIANKNHKIHIEKEQNNYNNLELLGLNDKKDLVNKMNNLKNKMQFNELEFNKILKVYEVKNIELQERLNVLERIR